MLGFSPIAALPLSSLPGESIAPVLPPPVFSGGAPIRRLKPDLRELLLADDERFLLLLRAQVDAGAFDQYKQGFQ